MSCGGVIVTMSIYSQVGIWGQEQEEGRERDENYGTFEECSTDKDWLNIGVGLVQQPYIWNYKKVFIFSNMTGWTGILYQSMG